MKQSNFDRHCEGFKVGEEINALIYPSTVAVGKLTHLSEDKQQGILKTEHGKYRILMVLALKV